MRDPEDDLFDDKTNEDLCGDPVPAEDEAMEQTTHLLTFLNEGFYDT